MRRRSLALLVSSALLLSVGAGSGVGQSAVATPVLDPPGTISPAAEPRVVASLVSSPDLFNADLGDVRGVRGWRPGKPNSWNESKGRAVRTIFRQLAAERADGYLVAGDTVNGHWDRDTHRTGIFGPSRTLAQKRSRVRAAGRFYYGEWKGFWRAAGVPMRKVHPAVGDHEIGDNPWSRSTGKTQLVPTFRDTWSRSMIDNGRKYRMRPSGQHRRTTYATYVTPSVLVVSLDVFDLTHSTVRPRVTAATLTWLRRVLAGANARDATIVVQGHTPVLGPVRTRASSALKLEGGSNSPLWKVLRRHGVDLYLAGEVHANTALRRRSGDPVQISHGSLGGYGPVAFMRIDVMSDGSLQMETRRIQVNRPNGRARHKGLWQTSSTIPAQYRLSDVNRRTGWLTLGPSGDLVSQGGDLTLRH